MATTEQDRAKAFELFDQGVSTNGVAAQLFKRYWIPAKKLRDEWQAARGETVTERVTRPAPKPKKAAKKDAPPDEDDGELIETWDVTLQLPAERLNDIFADFTPHEKANAIAAVLQAWMDAILEPVTEPATT